MTERDARQIRYLRRRGATWRRIAEHAADMWPDWGVVPGNQIDGMELCQQAAEVLGEDPNAKPWN